SEILREGNIRRLAVKWSVRARDMGGLVAEAMPKVGAAVKLPEGYRMVWSGRFEDQQRALARLYVIIPLVIFIIFVLLFAAFESASCASVRSSSRRSSPSSASCRRRCRTTLELRSSNPWRVWSSAA